MKNLYYLHTPFVAAFLAFVTSFVLANWRERR